MGGPSHYSMKSDSINPPPEMRESRPTDIAVNPNYVAERMSKIFSESGHSIAQPSVASSINSYHTQYTNQKPSITEEQLRT